MSIIWAPPSPSDFLPFLGRKKKQFKGIKAIGLAFIINTFFPIFWYNYSLSDTIFQVPRTGYFFGLLRPLWAVSSLAISKVIHWRKAVPAAL